MSLQKRQSEQVLIWCQALEARKTAQLKRVYYDLEDQLATNPSGNVPYTPSIPLLYGLRETLGLIKAEGMDNVIARHHRWVSLGSSHNQ